MSKKRQKKNHPIKAVDKEFLLTAAAPIEVEAAEGEKLPKFSITAYTGSELNVGGFYYPVVVDLTGMQAATPFPILKNHDSNQIVGHAETINITQRTLKLTGIVSGAGPAAREVVESGQKGFPWRASIGARVTSLESVKEGESVLVNGQRFTGPINIARKSILGETSFVPFAADKNTKVKISAKEFKKMKFEKWLKENEKWLQAMGFEIDDLTEEQRGNLETMYQEEVQAQKAKETSEAPAKSDTTIQAQTPTETEPAPSDNQSITETMRAEAAAESERICAIRKACEGKYPDLEAQAIKEGWDKDRIELEVKYKQLEANYVPNVHVDSAAVSAEVLAIAVMQSTGIDENHLAAMFADKDIDAANKLYKRCISLKQLVVEAASVNGYQGPKYLRAESDIRDAFVFACPSGREIRAGFSTISLPGILSNVANKFILESFKHFEDSWRRIAKRRPVSDFKQITSYRLTGSMEYEQVGPDGELKHGEVGEESFTNQAKTYGKIFAITRTMIINDDLSALDDVKQKLGRGAALKLNKVFWTEFLNNSAFFKTANKNYKAGADTVLSIDALTAAELLFLNQTDPDGNPLGIMPTILLVPNALYRDAKWYMESPKITEGGGSSDSKVPTNNIFTGDYEIVKSSYLANALISGNSAKAWYLLARPEDLPVIEVCFLNGKEVPTIESADADFNTLGIQFRGYHDFGMKKQEHRAGVKMKGES